MIDWYRVALNQGDAKAQAIAGLQILIDALDNFEGEFSREIALDIARQSLDNARNADIYKGAES